MACGRVMAHVENVNVNVVSGKKKQEQNSQEEEKSFLKKETISIRPSENYYYDLELTRGDHLRGEIFSNCPIDLYFVDEDNFEKWNKHRYLDPENCNKGVFETHLDYEVRRKGTWYLLIENNGRKSARVKILLY